jgi:STE24 endopeptidase
VLADPLVFAILLVPLFVALVVLLPVLMLRGLDAHEPDPALAERLHGLARRQGLRVRGVRVMRARRQKVANAAIMGLLPWLRYIVVTDHLLDTFTDDEVDAVLAHEIGHGRQHHLLIKTGATIGLAVSMGAAGFGIGYLVDTLAPGADPVWLLVLMPMLFPVVVVVVHGVLGLRLERRADEYAVDLVGLDPTLRALEKLAEANAARRRTGRVWNLLQQHPGIADRVEHLRARASAG